MLDYRALVYPHLAALKRYRWQALCVAWLVCLAGWMMLATIPDRYTSKARIYIDTETILGPLMKGLAVAPDFDRQVEMMRRTLLSVPNIEELIRMTDLDHTVRNDLERVGLIEELIKTIKLKTEGASLFEISYENEDPRLAQRVVDSIIQIFVEQNLGHSQRDVEEARGFIDKQIVDYESKLREAELEVAKFRKKHGSELGGIERNLRALEQREAELRRLNTEIESALWRRSQLKAQLDTTARTVTTPLGGAGSLQGSLRSRLQSLVQELDSKLLVYTEQHPEILALRQLIAQTEQRIRRQSQGRGASNGIRTENPLYTQMVDQLQVVEATIQDLERRVELTENDIAALSKNVASAPEVEADLTRLTRDYNVLLAQYEQLIQRRESANLAKNLDSDISRIEYRIIDPPRLPLQPTGPTRGLFMAAILIVGFGSGIVFAIGRQLMSGSFLTVDQLKAAFDLPILGGVCEAISPEKRGGAMAGWAGVAAGCLALVGTFGVLLYLSQITPAPAVDTVASGSIGSPLQWIWAKL